MRGQDIVSETLKKNDSSNRFGSTTTGIKVIGIDGLDELIQQFMGLGSEFIVELSEPSERCAELIAARARRKVHSIDHDLVNGIVVQTDRNKYLYGKNYTHKRNMTFARVKLEPSAAHGVAVELGHRLSGYFGTKDGSANERVKEHPFLRPAADESKGEVFNIMADAMNKIIAEHGGK